MAIIIIPWMLPDSVICKDQASIVALHIDKFCRWVDIYGCWWLIVVEGCAIGFIWDQTGKSCDLLKSN